MTYVARKLGVVTSLDLLVGDYIGNWSVVNAVMLKDGMVHGTRTIIISPCSLAILIQASVERFKEEWYSCRILRCQL